MDAPDAPAEAIPTDFRSEDAEAEEPNDTGSQRSIVFESFLEEIFDRQELIKVSSAASPSSVAAAPMQRGR